MVEAEVRPSEDREKVKTAISSLFKGEIHAEGKDIDYGRARLEAEGRGSLENFKMILQRDRIRAAARSALLRGIENQGITVFLNKQVAYVGHISFSAPQGESPLGSVRLRIETLNPMEIIDWLTGGAEMWRKR